MNLKEAREKGKLKDFIKEHSKDLKGDKDKFDKILKSISSSSSQKSKSAQETLPRDSSES